MCEGTMERIPGLAFDPDIHTGILSTSFVAIAVS